MFRAALSGTAACSQRIHQNGDCHATRERVAFRERSIEAIKQTPHPLETNKSAHAIATWHVPQSGMVPAEQSAIRQPLLRATSGGSTGLGHNAKTLAISTRVPPINSGRLNCSFA